MRRIVLLAALCSCASSGTASENSTPRQATIYSGPDTPTILAEQAAGGRRDHRRSRGGRLARDKEGLWGVRGAAGGGKHIDAPDGQSEFLQDAHVRRTIDAAARGLRLGNDGAESGVVPHLHVAAVDGGGRRQRRDDTADDIRAGWDRISAATAAIAFRAEPPGRLEALFNDRVKAVLGKSSVRHARQDVSIAISQERRRLDSPVRAMRVPVSRRCAFRRE